jgi:hypothetical protein
MVRFSFCAGGVTLFLVVGSSPYHHPGFGKSGKNAGIRTKNHLLEIGELGYINL